MPTLILDAQLEDSLRTARAESGADRFDEVWEETYVAAPFPNDEHQEIVLGLSSLLYNLVQTAGLGKVRAGVNVSDRRDNWQENYRCPDIAVFLNGSPAENLGTHWRGGPDFAVEVISRGDETRRKLDFYARIGTRELLIIDRFPWAIELYHLHHGKWRLIDKAAPDTGGNVASAVLPLAFALASSADRPLLEVVHAESKQTWRI